MIVILCPVILSLQNFAPNKDLKVTCVLSRGVRSHPPGGLLSFMKNTQAANNGISPQHINVDAEDNDGNCARTEKCLLWTKEEDLRLVSYFLG
jgi:hypothetical protein